MSLILLSAILGATANLDPGTPLFDFSSAMTVDAWYAINDGVMGGLSSGRLFATNGNTAVFAGSVSLKNNGGFASIRSKNRPMDLSPYTGLRLRIRGDGRRYKINLKSDRAFDGLLYRAAFDTQDDRWQTVDVLFSEFEPTFRGRVIEGAPDLDLKQVQSLGLMISDKQAGPFRLELRWIDVVSPGAPPQPPGDK